MKKKILKIVLIFIFILIILGLSKNVEANSISKISMDVYIDNNGNAEITETWNCGVNQGTEVYHPYYNLGNSEITNLRVSDETKAYTTLSYWNTSGTLESKAYKCGINEISNGVELCWGISKYGTHTYTVKYNISKFVSELTDSQMIYWTLIPYDFSNSIGDVKIRMHTASYIQDTIDVWGYGNYGGLCYVSNGSIYMDSNGKLDKSEYMTLLAKFPLGTFNTSNKLSYGFNHYYEMAQDNAEEYQKEYDNDNDDDIADKVMFWLAILQPITICIFVIIFYKVIKKSGEQARIELKEKKIDEKEINYYRDIPCKGNIFEAFYIANDYEFSKKSDFLGAIMLKWIKEGKVRINKTQTGIINKKEETAIVLNKDEMFENEKEKQLYSMLYKASGDGILEKKEFKRWCSGKYDIVLDWFSGIIYEERDKLVEKGLIIKEKKKSMKIFTKIAYIRTPELKQMALDLLGLKKYLLEYTLIKEREAIEVTLFEDYLIFAQLMGIADKVAKQFKDLYPKIMKKSHFISYDDIVFIQIYSYTGISAAENAKRDEEIRDAESYSSGGGGYSSGGGGGGSFGGGGGRRRFPLKISNLL